MFYKFYYLLLLIPNYGLVLEAVSVLNAQCIDYRFKYILAFIIVKERKIDSKNGEK